RRRTGLKSKMVEAGRNAEPAIDAGIVVRGHIGNSLRFQKGDQLIAPDIKKEVSKAPAFFDLYRVGDDRLKAQNVLVKLARLVEIEGRQTNVGNSSVTHDHCSFDFSL